MSLRLDFTIAQPLLPVRSIEDIDFLVKENEILSGRAGRTFVLVGTQCQRFRIELKPGGYLLSTLDQGGTAMGKQFVDSAQWRSHTMVRALHAGLVFTVDAESHA